jgi:hypothetical protein
MLTITAAPHPGAAAFSLRPVRAADLLPGMVITDPAGHRKFTATDVALPAPEIEETEVSVWPSREPGLPRRLSLSPSLVLWVREPVTCLPAVPDAR